MTKLLVDSSVIIDFLRRKNKQDTLLYKLVEEGCGLNISLITHTELYAGKSVWQKKTAQKELEELFSGIHILHLDTKISQKAGEIRAKYDTNLFDAIIAATSITYEIELVTLNVKDFEMIPKIKLYQNNIKPN